MTDRFIAGIVGAPFGLHGFIKVKPLSGEVDHLLKLKSVTVRQDGKDFLLAIAESSAVSGLIMRFTGYDSPEAVKQLSGAQLLVDRKDAAPLLPGEFYIEDLKGLAVIAGAHPEKTLGHIISIIEGGGGELAEIQLPDGTVKLVPFRTEFFTAVDTERKQAILTHLWILE